MGTPSDKIRTLTAYIGLSVLAHLLVLISLGRFGDCSFAAPVNTLQAVMVDLAKSGDGTAPVADAESRKSVPADDPADAVPEETGHARAQEGEVGPPPAVPENVPRGPESVEPAVSGPEKTENSTRVSEPAPAPQPAASRQTVSATAPPPR